MTDVAWGLPGDPRYFLVYLNTWEVAGLTDAERVGFGDHLWHRIVARVGQPWVSGVALVLARPDLPPGGYGEVRYQDAGLGWWPDGKVNALAATRWHDPTRDRLDGSAVMIAHRGTAPTAEARAAAAYHELLHAVGLWMHPPLGNDGPEDGPKARQMWASGVVNCARIAAKHRGR